ncbi:methylated-DNA--[protein]-cysteine S-methyltransferase [Streptomyces sp. H10-C2]|uniref:methylated-DNA--[protein]-cysteine S-methyltransferase n=1 Tax=unclassified Streptomyces TaxID=2593676 RepID=UPI0024B933F6|nr:MULTISPECIES: methylated-DNA--[protein]-cysteine S-methyltransferase [unclassified Streptomyces]MDJ0342377.1 methylated-DNA--[protein]-cysteine S-methyltransferase [Streptomyces sp. PH10-H1]MDJ0372232.1 methylated-DNA--[protein]-cysteine S-methyltransferase [Streptomyces sp. H10-C2]
MSTRTHTVTDSPCGPLTLVALDGTLCGLYMTQQRHRPAEETFGDRDDSAFGAVEEQLAAYFAGELTDFELPMTLLGTPFQQRVWSALRDIPYGETRSYGRLADLLGNPGASRAVGLANGKNPIGVIVPCHRVVGSTGSLTGYGGGLDRKRYLLAFEQGSAEPAALF